MRSRTRPPDSILRIAGVGLLFALLAGCGDDDAPAPSDAADEPGMLEQITRPGEGGAVHLVRLVQRGDSYAFEPADISVPPGDVVRFVMVGSQPESVVFDATGLDPEMADFVRRGQLDRGVLLTDPGAAYDVSFAEAPVGRYPFHSEPHAGLGMRGVVTVTE